VTKVLVLTTSAQVAPAALRQASRFLTDIARTCHPHPTFTEAVKEAALAVDKRVIHM
jgi:hypothetical protein